MTDFMLQTTEAYTQAKENAIENPELFWSQIADRFEWHQKWDKVLEYDFHKPEVKWFIGGKLNITENCQGVGRKFFL